MSKEVLVTFYSDTRRVKEIEKNKDDDPKKRKIDKNEPCSLKLRLYHTTVEKERLFRTGYNFSKAEFNQAIKLKPQQKDENKISKQRKNEISEIVYALRNKAEKILKDLPEFSFEAFERRYYNKSSKLDVCNYYEDYIKQLENNKKVRTAEVYRLSLLRLKTYLEHKGKPTTEISFETVNPKFLESFKNYYSDLGRTNATIGIYLRPLRTIFNQAINDPNSGVKKSLYPFGKKTAKKFQIPAGYKKKKALTKEQLKILFEAKPENEYQKRAKAFWFFSYLANGMNLKDIALLTYDSLNGNEISFERAKTRTEQSTAKDEIKVVLPPFAMKVIKEYGIRKNKKENYIFPILSKTDTPLEQSNKIKNFNRFVGQHIKKLAIANGLPSGISSYWARHSFATFAINHGGASMELVQESLGHKNIKTTQNYFAGFTTDVKKKLSESLLNFN